MACAMRLGLRLRAGRATEGKIVLFEGDGGLFFNIQELDKLNVTDTAS